jgi:hypothetical protein
LTVLLSLGSTGAAFAQLTAADIQALRERGEREGWTFEVRESWATSRSLDELCGLVVPDKWWEGAPFDPCPPQRDLPAYFDWRYYGGCTPIRNQGNCGSCWAFATAGALECNIRIEDGVIEDLSEQWLVSCNSEGYGCDGGWWVHDYFQWKTDPCGGTGAVMESDFPYVAWEAPCDCPYPHEYFIDGWAFIGSESGVPPVNSMKQAIMDYGPISVALRVNDAFQAYGGGVFNGCESGEINHAVVLVGWNDDLGTDGVWYLRNSWGTDWGNTGYMRIPYDCSSVGYAAVYVDYAGIAPTLAFEYPNGRPEMLDPGQETRIRVNVLPDTGTPVPATGQVHYSLNGGAYTTADMDIVGTNQYEAVLPPADCYDVCDWYVSAQEAEGERLYDPDNAPTSVYTATVLTGMVVVMEDNFETDQGWSVSGDATDGMWDRGVPVGGGDRGDPASDYDGSGQCYLTDNVDNNSDVDNGYTYLDSPTLDLSSGDAEVHYALWYTNDYGSDPDNDLFKIYVSNDNGGNWTLVETVGPTSPSGWNEHAFMVADYVTPTSQVKVRFEASDLGSGSVVEAGIDDFWVKREECIPPQFTLTVNTDGDGSVAKNPDQAAYYNEYVELTADPSAGWSFDQWSGDLSGSANPETLYMDGDKTVTAHFVEDVNDCPEDLNGDEHVGIADLSALLANYGQTGMTPEDGDFDGDGDVDIQDLSQLLGVYGQDCPTQ